MFSGLPIKPMSKDAYQILSDNVTPDLAEYVMRGDHSWEKLQAVYHELAYPNGQTKRRAIDQKFEEVVLKAAKRDNYATTMGYLMEMPDKGQQMSDDAKKALQESLGKMQAENFSGPEKQAAEQVIDCFEGDLHFQAGDRCPSYQQVYGMINEVFPRKSIQNRLAMTLLEEVGKVDKLALKDMIPKTV